jgi:hypothetical protein
MTKEVRGDSAWKLKALIHYLCNMEYVGKHVNNFNADDFIAKYRSRSEPDHDRYGKVVALRDVGYKRSEIADKLEININTVNAYITKANKAKRGVA